MVIRTDLRRGVISLLAVLGISLACGGEGVTDNYSASPGTSAASGVEPVAGAEDKDIAASASQPLSFLLSPSRAIQVENSINLVNLGIERLASGANRLVNLQADITEDNARNGAPDVDPDDGGWDWQIASGVNSHSAESSPENIYGAIGLGLWAAQNTDAKGPRIATALADVYKGIKKRDGVDSPPDFVFLVLHGIESHSKAAWRLAKSRYDAKIAQYGSATKLAEFVRDARHSSSADGLIPYDLGYLVIAATALDFLFPSEKYKEHAKIYGTVVAEQLGTDGFFNIENAHSAYYTEGLAWAALALSWSGVDTDKLSVLRGKLIDMQLSDGSWYWNVDYTDGSAEVTALVIQALALAFPTNPSAIWAALGGSEWLAGQQLSNGGWSDSASENSLVTAEAMTALFLVPPLQLNINISIGALSQSSNQLTLKSSSSVVKRHPAAIPLGI